MRWVTQLALLPVSTCAVCSCVIFFFHREISCLSARLQRETATTFVCLFVIVLLVNESFYIFLRAFHLSKKKGSQDICLALTVFWTALAVVPLLSNTFQKHESMLRVKRVISALGAVNRSLLSFSKHLHAVRGFTSDSPQVFHWRRQHSKGPWDEEWTRGGNKKQKQAVRTTTPVSPCSQLRRAKWTVN